VLALFFADASLCNGFALPLFLFLCCMSLFGCQEFSGDGNSYLYLI